MSVCLFILLCLSSSPLFFKTKKDWKGGRRWFGAAAMEILECVECFHGRSRMRFAQPPLPPESPPPPYSRFNVDLLRPEDAAPSEDSFESLETGGTYQYYSYSNNGPGTDPWCQIAYWENSARVGHMYPVRTPSLKIIGNIPHEEGLCLASLSSGPNYSPTEQSRKTKEKIGLGLVLYQEGGGVWVYNRSTIPMFVNSPNMDGGIHSRFNFNVHKLLPGHVINIFDYDRARLYQRLPLNPELMHEGPIDQNSVRLSFAKGWGRNYQRQEITQCPCWLEILLVVPVR